MFKQLQTYLLDCDRDWYISSQIPVQLLTGNMLSITDWYVPWWKLSLIDGQQRRLLFSTSAQNLSLPQIFPPETAGN